MRILGGIKIQVLKMVYDMNLKKHFLEMGK